MAVEPKESTMHASSHQSAASTYKAVQSSTLTPGELLLALYDSMLGRLRAARMLIDRKETARAREQLTKTYAILSELLIALDPSKSQELCTQLGGIYAFCMDRVLTAGREGSTTPIDEVIRVLNPLHEAWRLAVPKAARDASLAAGTARGA
jgi:flagellar protein FliS